MTLSINFYISTTYKSIPSNSSTALMISLFFFNNPTNLYCNSYKHQGAGECHFCFFQGSNIVGVFGQCKKYLTKKSSLYEKSH